MARDNIQCYYRWTMPNFTHAVEEETFIQHMMGTVEKMHQNGIPPDYCTHNA
ncbi:hypothetical protein ACJX0J_021809, partial [Zea mays]